MVLQPQRQGGLGGGQIEVFKILNGYENIDRNIFFLLKKDSRTRGHEITLVKINVDWISGSTHSHRRQ